jgi:molecular chaperone Hsp33
MSTDLFSQASYSRRFTLENLDIRGQVVRLGDAWHTLMNGRDYPSDVTRYFESWRVWPYSSVRG